MMKYLVKRRQAEIDDMICCSLMMTTVQYFDDMIHWYSIMMTCYLVMLMSGNLFIIFWYSLLPFDACIYSMRCWCVSLFWWYVPMIHAWYDVKRYSWKWNVIEQYNVILLLTVLSDIVILVTIPNGIILFWLTCSDVCLWNKAVMAKCVRNEMYLNESI
jgi:hypothetical protein